MATTRPVYSKSLFAGAPTAAFVNVYTVPTGFTTVVRDITLYSSESTFYSQLQGPQLSGEGFMPIYGLSPWEARSLTYFHWEGRHVMTTGTALAIATPAAEAGIWQWTISGYELTLP